jgi:hypothetical protein
VSGGGPVRVELVGGPLDGDRRWVDAPALEVHLWDQSGPLGSGVRISRYRATGRTTAAGDPVYAYAGEWGRIEPAP